MNISAITSYIDAVERQTSLYKETAFDQRMEVIDFIGFQLLDCLTALLHDTADAGQLLALRNRAEKMKAGLEAIDRQLFQHLRHTIRNTGCTGPAFKKLVGGYFDIKATPGEDAAAPGYDNLDLFLNGLSPLQTMPEPTKDLEPEMVYFQKTPARIVFELVDQVRFVKEDVFFDLGAGLGQVAILVHLLAGIRTIGVEFEPAFCHYARQAAAALNLPAVTFINTDARKADYSEGTVFFMFTPFTGEILQDVLDMLRKESLQRRIKIITYGPCTTHVASQHWLRCISPIDQHTYKLGVFHSG
ncbi:class I SAM-dependent methyltransferase [Chitinophaga arvensicola]|uniref:Histone methylation protein DOT1 n=1 Tax=Chitinophaga arvensicola TaxID=29529 RepID=A0A1I0S6Y1_9BACT|nr:class I SAM-dependent methyltransferase [Chitinophaga arvensicola]SEW51481.1 Histone methylation protein DOT1 [Chitinophaga arvensicola]